MGSRSSPRTVAVLRCCGLAAVAACLLGASALAQAGQGAAATASGAGPNDPYFPQQWALHGLYGIHADRAWAKADGTGIRIAILDSGVTDHGDVFGNLAKGFDFITDARNGDGNGRDEWAWDPGDWVDANSCPGDDVDLEPEDSSWHGIQMAGVAGATMDNGMGIAGVAPRATIVPVRVVGRCDASTSDIADAIVWAAGGSVVNVPDNQYPAEVINLSLGIEEACPAVLQRAIDFAVSMGTTVVVSAGNENKDASEQSPANCRNVVVVAASTKQGDREAGSNYGSLVDIAAPGEDIVSTSNDGKREPDSGAYSISTGTSPAAAHVSGVVALLKSVANRPKTPAEIEALLKATATPFPNMPTKPIGAGIVNAERAVDAVLRENAELETIYQVIWSP